MIFDLAGAARISCILLLGICMAALGASPLTRTSKPPATVFGEYLGSGCPAKRRAAPCLPTRATDRVRILHSKDGDATVNVKIVFAHGHTCTLMGGAAWADGYFTLRADGLDPGKPCQLLLHINGPVLTLEDPGATCREVYCGTSGAFDGARFKKKRS